MDIDPKIIQTLNRLECFTLKKDEEPVKQLGKCFLNLKTK